MSEASAAYQFHDRLFKRVTRYKCGPEVIIVRGPASSLRDQLTHQEVLELGAYDHSSGSRLDLEQFRSRFGIPA